MEKIWSGSWRSETDRSELSEGCRDSEDPDAHSCSACADDYGLCSVCGAIVHGTSADYELHGYDPPDSY